MTTIIVGEENLHIARMCSLKAMLKLEIYGAKRKGRTAYAIIKEEFGLKGSKVRVLEQFTKMCETKLNTLGGSDGKVR